MTSRTLQLMFLKSSRFRGCSGAFRADPNGVDVRHLGDLCTTLAGAVSDVLRADSSAVDLLLVPVDTSSACCGLEIVLPVELDERKLHLMQATAHYLLRSAVPQVDAHDKITASVAILDDEQIRKIDNRVKLLLHRKNGAKIPRAICCIVGEQKIYLTGRYALPDVEMEPPRSVIGPIDALSFSKRKAVIKAREEVEFRFDAGRFFLPLCEYLSDQDPRRFELVPHLDSQRKIVWFLRRVTDVDDKNLTSKGQRDAVST